jgi:hypothetical protein
VDIDRLIRRPSTHRALAQPDHLRGVRGDPLVVEDRLDQPALSLVHLAFTGQEVLADQALRDLHRRALHEVVVAGREDVPDEVGAIHDERGETRRRHRDHVTDGRRTFEHPDGVLAQQVQRGQTRQSDRGRRHGDTRAARAADTASA